MKQTMPPKTGEVVAALLALWLGITALTASHIWTIADPYKANTLLLKLGSWIPGWWGIGPFAGKETAGLVVWLSSWGVLHLLLRRWNMLLKPWFYGCMIGLFVDAILTWPPVYHAIWGWLPTVLL